MKRFITIIMALTMTLSLLALAVGAGSFRPNPSPIDITIKKADSSLVVKDGLISAGEYERLSIDTTLEDSPLHMAFASDSDLPLAEAMLPTMEYYFSWDEVHGLNFAVRYKPTDLKQTLGVKEGGEFPEDHFAKNCALIFFGSETLEASKDMKQNLFYAIAKSTVTGEYIEGHYGQFGPTGSYDPVAGQDYCIAYDFDNGYVTYEWSVPCEKLGSSASAGSNLYFTISATAGKSETLEGESAYVVSLGDFGYYVDRKQSERHTAATLSAEVIDAGSVPTPNPGGGSGSTGTSGDGGTNTAAGTDGQSAGTSGDGGTADTGTVNASQTSDPMLILAAVSAVSACGALVIRKRRS